MYSTFFDFKWRLMNQSDNKSSDQLSRSKEKELIRLAQRGDFFAFEELYKQNFDRVFKRVWYLVPRQDVEDVTQETFAAAVKSLKSFRGNSKFSTWLRTLTNRQIANYYRSRNRSETELDMDIEDLDFIPSIASNSKLHETDVDDMILLNQGLDKLPEHYREILLLRFADGMKFKDIADHQNKSIESTKSLFRRAISSLRDQLGDKNV